MTIPAPERILVVRVGRAGDLVMITPALRMILDGFPGAEVHVVTSTEGRRVLTGFDSRITHFHLYDRRFGSWLKRGKLVSELRGGGYARAYLFESHRHYRELIEGAAPSIHAIAARGTARHYCDRCMDVVEPTLPRPVPRGWVTLPVIERGRAAAREYLAAHQLGDHDRLVGLHLTFSESSRGWFGRRREHREWPLDSCVDLARRLHEHGRERGVPIRPILDVLPADRAMADAFAARAGDAVTVLSGAPDFERYKALLERCALFVAPNTGPMHMAAAVGTPVVALFSGWSPEDCGPFTPADRHRVLRAEDTPHPERGLAAIGADRVFEACRPFLE